MSVPDMLPLLSILLASSALAELGDDRVQFDRFMLRANKTYSSLGEEESRFSVFRDNLRKIEKHNSEGHSWTMGVTKFADLTK